MKKIISTKLIIIFILFPNLIFSKPKIEPKNFSYGIVFSISDKNLQLIEYNFRNQNESINNYIITPETKIENTSSFKNLSIDDTVIIDFVTKNKRKIAKKIMLKL